MANISNDFQTLSPIHKKAYAKSVKRGKGKFEKLRKKLLNSWKPKKTTD